MAAEILVKMARTLKRYTGVDLWKWRYGHLYDRGDYLEAYTQHTDQRVAKNPRAAIGGMWDVIGKLQFDFLVGEGMKPHHRLLDIGCGTLRGGQHSIRYLEPGHYTGIDISPRTIECARKWVEDEGLSEKRPRLVVNEKKELKFEEFAGERFDYLLAQSVFTHLMPKHIEECFEHVGSVMAEGGSFYFTFKRGKTHHQTGLKDFVYPFSFFEELASRNGFVVSMETGKYPHPRGQIMCRLRKPG